MNNLQNTKMNNKPIKSGHATSKIPTSGRDSGIYSRSSSVSNLTTASDIHSEVGDSASDNPDDFKVDERIWFNGTKPGYIKFVGKTQFAPGIWVGVLLDEPIGNNDGSVAGVKYFTCEPLRGIFAQLSKLTRTPGAVTRISDSSMNAAIQEKVTQLIEDNRNLSDQILLKEEQAKGKTDDVIKELGEKVKILNEELKSKYSKLLEIISSNEETDKKISSMEVDTNNQIEALSQLRNKYSEICEALHTKDS